MTVAVLFLVALLNYVDRSILSILQEPIKRDLNLSDTQLGALTGLSFALLYATLAIPVARLADRGKRTRLLAGCVALWSMMTALVHFATGFWTMVVLRMGVALGEAGSGPISHSIIGDVVARERRGRALALMALAVPTGTMLGFLSAGWLASATDWRNTFLILGLIGLVAAPLVARLAEPTRHVHSSIAAEALLRSDSWSAALSSLWRMAPFRHLLIAASFHSFALYGFQNWAAPFYMRVHHLTTGEVGTALAVMFGLGGGLGAFLGGYLVDLLGRRKAQWYGWVPALAGLGALPCLVAQLLLPSVWAALGCGFVAILLMNVFIAPTNATAQACVPSGMRALTSATLLAVPSIVGVGLAPLITGAASDWLMHLTQDASTIRFAILVPVCTVPVAAWFFDRAGRALREQFETVGQF